MSILVDPLIDEADLWDEKPLCDRCLLTRQELVPIVEVITSQLPTLPSAFAPKFP